MALRGIAGDMARNTAGIWKAVAQAVDPKPPAAAAEPAPAPDPVIEDDVLGVERGQMLVPIDAWTRILEQVGHVHEAGQQLAEARERAARAETENEFLRAQLRDLKTQKRPPRRPAAPSPSQAAAPAPSPASAPSKAQRRLRRVRQVAGGWISPE